MIIVHHTDMDGLCCAAIALRWAKMAHPDASVSFCPMSYNDTFPLPVLEEGETLLILDFSLPPDEMVAAREKAGKVVWIDHHDTHLEVARERGYDDLPGIRLDGSDRDQPAACELTWKYFMGEDTDVPRAVRLIGAFDMWRHDDMLGVRDFHEGAVANNLHPENSAWGALLDGNDRIVTHLIYVGHTLREAQARRWTTKARACAFFTKVEYVTDDGSVESYNVLAINHFSSDGGSRVLESVDQTDADFVALFIRRTHSWKVSFFRDDGEGPHLGKIAEQVGKKHGPIGEPGGRATAAGMNVRELPFDLPGCPERG